MPEGDPVLFCPFCRECFEGERTCPDHGLPLVPFDKLPSLRRLPAWDEPLALWDGRFGRGLGAAGALAALVAFVSPLATGARGEQQWSYTVAAAAAGPAPNLWVVPFTAVVFAWVLLRRRTRKDLRAVSTAAMLLSLMPVLSLVYSLRNMFRGAAEMGLTLHPAAGAWLIGLSSALLLVGSVCMARLRPAVRS